ncbi:hypothetical protein I6B53_03740 [Schaalia sp. 19OD2882]|uniref:hypothetical protein n=1 Tax=Schaalia sp. 19OD2882 TaxID=2794089 RepID=UPI001C1ECA99|nr:hypothetical protein [Schaalia sp. 19OD2882]QWW20219.1 hypothetical protein I6B53_03740 [Schaalia sp. 19OD2882]
MPTRSGPPGGRLSALAAHLVGLAASTKFFLYMGGYRLFQSFIWNGRTTGMVSLSIQRGPEIFFAGIARSCQTYFFYRPAEQALEGGAHLFAPCVEPATRLTVAFNPADPTQAVPVLFTAQEGFFVSLGMALVAYSVFLTIAAQVAPLPVASTTSPWTEGAVLFSHFYSNAWMRMMQDSRTTIRPSL